MTTVAPPRPATGSPSERFTSRDPEAFEVPSSRDEDWRFTPLASVRALFEPFTPTGALIGTSTAPEPVVVQTVPMSDLRVGRTLAPADRVSALAFAHSSDALIVGIPANAELDEPVVIDAGAVAGLAYAHLVIDVGTNARAGVVVNYSGTATIAENVEIIVGDSAQLNVVFVHAFDREAVHISAHAALVGRDATLRHSNICLGGSVVRIAPTVRYAGPGGSTSMFGVGFAEDGQHFESRLFVDHSAPQCTSNVLYKNALQGERARTVWIGDVRIRPSAVGTETFELNRNLLLSGGARADSVPNLEIETGDIAGAGHASATGRFDDLQLFYLQARGIPEHVARRLVVRGFFADVVERIGLPDLQAHLMSVIEARLGATSDLNELDVLDELENHS